MQIGGSASRPFCKRSNEDVRLGSGCRKLERDVHEASECPSNPSGHCLFPKRSYKPPHSKDPRHQRSTTPYEGRGHGREGEYRGTARASLSDTAAANKLPCFGRSYTFPRV